MQRIWNIKGQVEETVKAISSSCGVSEIIARLLINRGFDSCDKINEFFNKNFSLIHDPFLMKDMDKAVSRIRKAVETHEKVTIYGDYDVDGVTSVCVLYLYLSSLGVDVEYYIPDRNEEGYGINCAALDKIKSSGSSLLITVDTGIMALDESDYASKIGLDVIVTDHHECGDSLPGATAVVNPKRKDCPYPFKELAGVGVVFKLISAFAGSEKFDEIIDTYAEIISIGTVADVVPLVDENRILVAKGIEKMRGTKNFGLKALMALAGIENKKITASVVGYVLAPRINAAGRFGSAKRAVQLFLAKNYREAQEVAKGLCEENRQRRSTESDILAEAISQLEQSFNFEEDKVIVLCSDKWHNGIIGVVASRITDKYNLPCILISFDGDVGKGSGRSIKGFNLFDALSYTSSLLVKYGGHELAAGLTINRANLDEFKKMINEYAKHVMPDESISIIDADCQIGGKDITVENARDILKLEPYGAGNPVPQFFIEELEIADITPVSDDKHIKLTFKLDDKNITAFYFGVPIDEFQFACNDIVDIICNMDLSTYKGFESVQLIIKDMRLSGSSKHCLESSVLAYNLFKSSGEISLLNKSDIPSRADFIAVYRFLKKHMQNRIKINPEVVCRQASWYSKANISYFKLMIILDVFEEMGLLEISKTRESLIINIRHTDNKINLDKSSILSNVKNKIKCGN